MSRSIALCGLFAVQALCCAYFLMDITWDLLWPGAINTLGDSDIVEAIVTAALFLSLAFTVAELRTLLRRHDHLEDQIKLASGAFGDVLEQHFRDWGLTSAEREIAILAIKGFSVAEMAGLRDTRQGTVKAQCASVYRKADVSGRLQLLSIFLDDLMAEELIQSTLPEGRAI